MADLMVVHQRRRTARLGVRRCLPSQARSSVTSARVEQHRLRSEDECTRQSFPSTSRLGEPSRTISPPPMTLTLLATEVEDEVLISRCLQNDWAAFDQLYQKHIASVSVIARYLLSCPQDVEDVTQATFVEAFQTLQRGERIRNAKIWLARSVRCNALNLRDTVWSNRVDLTGHDGDETLATPVLPARDSLSTELLRRLQRHSIRRAIRRLPAHERMVVYLRYQKEFTLAEIAELLDVPLQTVYSRLTSAAKHLRAALQDWYEHALPPPIGNSVRTVQRVRARPGHAR